MDPVEQLMSRCSSPSHNDRLNLFFKLQKRFGPRMAAQLVNASDKGEYLDEAHQSTMVHTHPVHSLSSMSTSPPSYPRPPMMSSAMDCEQKENIFLPSPFEMEEALFKPSAEKPSFSSSNTMELDGIMNNMGNYSDNFFGVKQREQKRKGLHEEHFVDRYSPRKQNHSPLGDRLRFPLAERKEPQMFKKKTKFSLE